MELTRDAAPGRKAETEAVRERIWARWKAWETQLLVERLKERSHG